MKKKTIKKNQINHLQKIRKYTQEAVSVYEKALRKLAYT